MHDFPLLLSNMLHFASDTPEPRRGIHIVPLELRPAWLWHFPDGAQPEQTSNASLTYMPYMDGVLCCFLSIHSTHNSGTLQAVHGNRATPSISELPPLKLSLSAPASPFIWKGKSR